MEIGQREQGEEEQSETTSPPELQSRGCGGGRQDAPQPSPRPARRVLMRSRAINLALPPTTRCKLPSPFASFALGSSLAKGEKNLRGLLRGFRKRLL